MDGWIAILAGICTGILSSWGIGGGTLLVLYMTLFAAVPQSSAQGINLLYFLPMAAAALFRYIKRGFIELEVWKFSAAAGCLTAAIASYLTRYVDDTVLRTAFGILLLYMGIRELLGTFGSRNRVSDVAGQ